MLGPTGKLNIAFISQHSLNFIFLSLFSKGTRLETHFYHSIKANMSIQLAFKWKKSC